jgi:hypothetical protein
VYVADTAFTKGGAGNEVEFVVQNFSENDILLTSYVAVYDEPAYYDKLEIGKAKVFDNKNSPAGTGDVLGFAGINITGTGASAGRIVPIRVQSG